MLFVVVVCLLKNQVATQAFQRLSDSCFVGNESQVNLTMSTACPLLPRVEFTFEASCLVTLDEKGITNWGCAPCYWNEKLDAMCYPTDHHQYRHCCCRTSDCNKLLVLDAIFGWGHATTENGTCLSASLSVNASEVTWKHNSPEHCENDEPICVLKLKPSSGGIESMQAGCMRNSEYNEENITSCKNGTNELGEKDGYKSWCCYGEQCSRKLYQKHVFNILQEIRLRDEDGYLGLVYKEMYQASEHVWATDQLYYETQPIFASIMYAFITIYFIGLYYIYVNYRPKEMHKLPPMARKRRTGSISEDR
ncbi:unnamed protein product [Cylicocyclus nassatus]|uniref:Uncharacterized protein n=1 Tax=Cylicocyclus nassatus TaxID=53992 RepID=A0AA36DP65_CYLNA|nr:unnamed protein product [Cylicocyclus nassatus]